MAARSRQGIALFAGSLAVVVAVACGSDYDEAERDPPDASPDVASVEACSGTMCGTRCCAAGLRCVDAGVCSSDPIALAAGLDFGCTLLADQSVWCWGSDAVGQLGPGGGLDHCTFNNAGHTSDVACQHRAKPVTGLPPIRAIAAGFQVACAITAADGAVYCWGDNRSSMLGGAPGTGTDAPCVNFTGDVDDAGTYASTSCSPTPRLVPGITGVKMLAVNISNVCALTESREVFCWGRANSIGSVVTSDSPTPVRVAGLPEDVRDIATGNYWETVCATTDSGKGFCWGRAIGFQGASATPQPLSGAADETALEDVDRVAVGNGHVCVLARDGSVRCFGTNEHGELGQRACSTISEGPQVVTGIPSAKTLASHWGHSCTLDEEGHVYCWGLAILGALGRGTTEGNLVCNPILTGATPGVVEGLPPVVALAVGTESTYVIDRDGKVWGWGTNDLARAGHAPKTKGDLLNCGDPQNQSVCNPKPMLVEGLP